MAHHYSDRDLSCTMRFGCFGPFLLLVLGAFSIIRVPDLAPTASNRGEEVFNTVCSTCHSLRPPAKLAPPMLMVLQHYFGEHQTDEGVTSAMQSWLAGPDSSKSSLPPHAIERFGLMPPLQLQESDVDAVIGYLLAVRSGDTTPTESDPLVAPMGRMRMRGDMLPSDSVRMGMGRRMRRRMAMSADSTGAATGRMSCGGQMQTGASCPMQKRGAGAGSDN